MLSAPQGPELWSEENSRDQELAAVLVSWTGPLTPGRSSVQMFVASAVLASPCLPEFKPSKLFHPLRPQGCVPHSLRVLPLLLLQESLTFEDVPVKKAWPVYPLGKSPFRGLQTLKPLSFHWDVPPEDPDSLPDT